MPALIREVLSAGAFELNLRAARKPDTNPQVAVL
jgi:hypothetical protein